MPKIAVFFHGLFYLGDELLPGAVDIVRWQMEMVEHSGLTVACSEFHVGLNGGEESAGLGWTIFPPQARIKLHGLQCKNECRTIRMLEEWLPGHEDWYVLYLHAKGVTHAPDDPFRGNWRNCMMKHLVQNWKKCVRDLDQGYDAVGCHWMEPPRTPPTQYIFAGNFWWSKASFLKTLPSILERARIKDSGIDSLESRYESEVWLGNGPHRPRVKDYHPNWSISPGPHP